MAALRYKREEILGRNCRFLQGPGTDRRAVKEIRTAVDNGQECTVRLINYTKSGRPFWNMFTLAPVMGADGKVRFFVGVQVDVTAKESMAAPTCVPPLPAALPDISPAAAQPAAAAWAGARAAAWAGAGWWRIRRRSRSPRAPPRWWQRAWESLRRAAALPRCKRGALGGGSQRRLRGGWRQASADPWKALKGDSVQPKPHKKQDPRWRAILAVKKLDGKLGVDNFVQIKRLGRGDVGNVFLVQLKGSNLTFAMKARGPGQRPPCSPCPPKPPAPTSCNLRPSSACASRWTVCVAADALVVLRRCCKSRR